MVGLDVPFVRPIFSSSDFWIFPELKSALKERRFQDIERAQKLMTSALKVIMKEQFYQCSQQWQHR